jgi:magnesium chelatase family protein
MPAFGRAAELSRRRPAGQGGGESRERVHSALAAMGLSLPPKRITVNLSPADLPKEGSHYDLPIALALLAAMGIVDREVIAEHVAVGELALDGRIIPSPGVLLAALHAAGRDKGLICPAAQGSEASWAGASAIGAPDLISLLNHLKGTQALSPPQPGEPALPPPGPDLRQVKGQETARRALEIAAAGGHNLLMVGPPGAGKSLMAACLPGILPPLTPAEALEVSMVASVAGTLEEGRISRARPFRAPHHSASMAALTGGGHKARPGEVSMAHLGVLFLDDCPNSSGLFSIRCASRWKPAKSPLRAPMPVTFPARVQLIAAMNPCRCGHLADPALAQPGAAARRTIRRRFPGHCSIASTFMSKSIRFRRPTCRCLRPRKARRKWQPASRRPGRSRPDALRAAGDAAMPNSTATSSSGSPCPMRRDMIC